MVGISRPHFIYNSYTKKSRRIKIKIFPMFSFYTKFALAKR
ncbi:hypothetical protein EVA_13981 [gut metagenome]|uniref:Uncharacterized protein n=1 Tax=gut metagenome TaxID=749906 RepID=J9FTS4_9ZZZZ